MKWILILILIANLVAFAAMGIDKRRAVKNRWRIPERVLLLCCAPLAAPGGLLGMRLFRHKTQKNKFRIGVPAMLIAQIALLIALLKLFH